MMTVNGQLFAWLFIAPLRICSPITYLYVSAAAKQYDAYREGEGVSERALFVIDKQGKIFRSYRSPIAVNPGADGILEALEKMNGIKSHVYTESAN
jgi:alkyl hydroperoxide reductase subunit AhpC